MISYLHTSRSIRRLALARLVSVTGSSAATTALYFLVYERTGAPLWVTVAMLATIGLHPVALAGLGGLGDSFDRRWVMIASDLASALLFSLLILDHPVGIVVVIAALATLAEAPFLPASAAAIPSLAEQHELGRANGIVNGAVSVGRMVGPLIAGGLFTLRGPDLVFAFNAASFLVSALLVVLLPSRMSSATPTSRMTSPWPAISHIRATRPIYLVLISSVMAYVTTSFAMVGEPPLADSFGVGAWGYGIMMAAWGIGLVIGSLVAAWRLSEATERQGLFAGRVVMGTGMTLVAITPWFPPIPPLMVVGGSGSGLLLAALYSQVQRHSPDAIRSNVFALFEAVGSAGFVIGVVSAGLIVQELGVRPAYLIAGLGTLASAVPLYRNLRVLGGGP